MRDPTAALEPLLGARPRVLTLLPEEPAGRISTRNAGAVFFEASLERRDEIPPGPILGEPVPGARFYSLIQRLAEGKILPQALGSREEDTISYSPERSDLAVDGSTFMNTAVRSETAASSTYRISCEIRALHAEPLAGALDATLRSITTHAALTEAVLETRAVRGQDPKVPSADLVEDLARQLWDAGLPVSFGPSWTPLADNADISVGIRGLERAFEAFLQECPTWQTLLH